MTSGWVALVMSAGLRDPGVESSDAAEPRNGLRVRRVQTAEGESEVEIPQVRQTPEAFASKLFLRTPKLLRVEPLKALVIGAFVCGPSMRDVESLCELAGLGKLSKMTGLSPTQEAAGRPAPALRLGRQSPPPGSFR